jgi:hypothetical protein
MSSTELDERFAAGTTAGVRCHVLLIADHRSIDIQGETERKWPARSAERGSAR